MRDDKLAVEGIRDTVLFRAWVELHLDGVFVVLLEGEGLDRAAEGWLDLETECCLKWASVLDRQVLNLRDELRLLQIIQF